MVAIFGGASRKGEWVVPAQLTAFAMFGGVELDLSSVTFAQAEAEIIAVAVMGGVEITVPEGLTVHVDGIGIFGGFDQKAEGPGEPGAPGPEDPRCGAVRRCRGQAQAAQARRGRLGPPCAARRPARARRLARVLRPPGSGGRQGPQAR